MPPFLTTRDLADGSLECKLHSNAHAVYALTVSVPEHVYNRLKKDEKLGHLKIVKEAFSDGRMHASSGQDWRDHATSLDESRITILVSSDTGKLIEIFLVSSTNSFLFEGPLGKVLTYLKDYRDITQENQIPKLGSLVANPFWQPSVCK